MTKEKNKYEDILNAATELFSEKGFYNATIKDIAKRAGIGKGTVYEYFINKDDLIIKTIESNRKRYIIRLKDKLSLCTGFDKKIDVFIEIHQKAVRHWVRIANVIMLNETPPLDGKTRKKLHSVSQQARDKVLKIVAEIFTEGQNEGKVSTDIDIKFVVDIFYAMIIRYCMRCAVLELDEKEIINEKNKLINLIMNGIGSDTIYYK